RRRQQEVLDSAMYYNEADWIHIMAQVEANASLSKTLVVPLSPVVSSHTSSGTRRKSLARKRLTKPKSTLQDLYLDADAQTFIKDLVKLYGLVVQYYETHPVAGAGLLLWGDLQVLFDSHEGARVKSFTDAQLKEEFEKIQKAISNTQIQAFSRTLKRTGHVPSVPADVSPSVASAGVSNKGKSLIVAEDIPVKARIFKQMEEDRLGEEAAKRLHDEEQAQLDRKRAELQRRRQQEVLDSAMYYNEADWIHIMAQMLRHKLEIDKDAVGNDMTTAEQLIQLIKNQLAAAHVSSV
nr:SGNH hydrolase-type esterase domain-containing protein [Tanacetum cinerariifolium]